MARLESLNRFVRLLVLLPTVTLVAALATARPAAASTGWGWPLAGSPRVVARFDPPSRPWLAGQRGVVLAARSGEPVYAAGDGVVTFAGLVARVPVVTIRHPVGLLTTYEPVRSWLRVGTRVVRGQRIGSLVVVGSECAPKACLHWGLRRGDGYFDPLELLGLGRIRLLPMLSDPPASPLAPLASATTGLAILSSATLWRFQRRRKPPFRSTRREGEGG